jgi:hypothetical protein
MRPISASERTPPVDSTAMSDYTDRLKAIGERVSAARGFL